MRLAFRLAFMVTLSLFGAAGLLSALPASADNSWVRRYSQIVLPLDTPRKVTYTSEPEKRELSFFFAATSPDELRPLESYDERLVQRLIMRDQRPVGTQVVLVLRDSRTRALVQTLDEPFRVLIDLFDRDYRDSFDPETDLPLAPQNAGGSSAATVAVSPWLDDQTGLGLQQPFHSPPRMSPRVSRGVSPQMSKASGLFVRPKVLDQPTAARQAGGWLAPTPKPSMDKQALAEEIERVPAGMGSAWQTFPEYVYRIQMPALEGQKASATLQLDKESKAFKDATSLAAHAGALFNFGHESKALAAYQEVLRQDPSIFDKDALHLWKLAESHLGQGSLVLADGYYQALREKHPSSPLAPFGLMRRLDVKSIQALAADDMAALQELESGLESIEQRAQFDVELAAQLLARRAYWRQGALKVPFDPWQIPMVQPRLSGAMGAVLNRVKHERSSFVLNTLMLHSMVSETTPWSSRILPMAASYLSTYKGKRIQPYRMQILGMLKDKFDNHIQGQLREQQYVEVTNTYKQAAELLPEIQGALETRWAIAESLRILGDYGQAIDHYAFVASKTDGAGRRFAAEFWLAVSAGRHAEELKAANRASQQVRKHQEVSKQADRRMYTAWQRLAPDQKQPLAAVYKADFERTLVEPALLKSPAQILLTLWTRRLSSQDQAAGADAAIQTQPAQVGQGLSNEDNPQAKNVEFLTLLAKRFSELGLPKERRQALLLLRRVQPEQIIGRPDLQSQWAKRLSDLAEEMRRSSEFLQAGELYAFTARNSVNWNKRAEALYKGGLLLYRSGRRTAAIEAFREASQDGENLFYANLAQERLERLEQE